MECRDDFFAKFSSMDAELLEDVEPSYLISLSDSQVSNHEFLSDFCSSDTLEVNSSSVNKAKGGVCYSGRECLFEEKHPSADYEKDPTFKPSTDFFDSAFRVQSLIFNDRDDMSVCCNYLKDRIINSISSLNLITYSMDCICEISKIHSSFNGCGRKGLSQSKRCVSLPNLNFTPKHEMIHIQRKSLQKIPCIRRSSEDSIVKLALHLANTHSFGDLLIKILLEKIHSMQLATEEKDALISELMHSYDKLIIKHAEAENKIDRMRFDNSISEGLSSVSTTTLSHNVPSVVNATSVVHPEVVNDVFDAALYEKHEDLGSRNITFQAVVAQRGLRKLESYKNEHDHKEEEFICGAIGLDVKNSEKGIVDTQVNKDDVLLHQDPDFHLCELDNTLNLEKLENDIILEECTNYRTHDISSDNDSFSFSDDELSLRNPRNHGILRTANPLHSEKSLKNNFNNSYNKIITYAKAKRELASYPDFHNLIYDGIEGDSHESLPNLDIQKVEETFIKSTKESTTILLVSENKNVKTNDAQRLAIENVGLTDSKVECIVIENASAVHPQALLDDDNCCQTENNNFPEKSSGLLNNVFVQGKSAYGKEDMMMPKYFYSRNSGSNFRNSVFDFNETKSVDNRIEIDVKNDFGGISSYAIPLYKKQLIFTKKEEPLEEESESSASLGSVELESCDCWNALPSSQIIRGCEKETLSIESKIAISPLHLDLSSSDEYSLPIFGINKQDCNETLKSLDDATIAAGKKKGLNQLQMKAIPGRLPLRDESRKIAESMQSIVTSDYSQKSVSRIMNSLNKIDAAASKLKCKTEGLKSYLSLQLDSIS